MRDVIGISFILVKLTVGVFLQEYNHNLKTFISTLNISEQGSGDDLALPKISIIIPSFNQAEFLERTILSVLNQHYANLELIIIDGGSSDQSVDIIKKYDSYIYYWHSRSDKGQSDALNQGFSVATGDIYGWLNSDDIYLPGAFDRVISAFNQLPDKKIIFGDWLSIDVDDEVIAYNYAFDFNINHFVYEGFHLNAQSMFWKQEVHHSFSQFDNNLYNTMDYQMILEFALNEGQHGFQRITYPLAGFRRHPDQKTTGSTHRVIQEHQQIATQYHFDDKFKIKGVVKRKLFRLRRAWWYIKRGGVKYCVKQIIS